MKVVQRITLMTFSIAVRKNKKNYKSIAFELISSFLDMNAITLHCWLFPYFLHLLTIFEEKIEKNIQIVFYCKKKTWKLVWDERKEDKDGSKCKAIENVIK